MGSVSQKALMLQEELRNDRARLAGCSRLQAGWPRKKGQKMPGDVEVREDRRSVFSSSFSSAAYPVACTSHTAEGKVCYLATSWTEEAVAKQDTTS